MLAPGRCEKGHPRGMARLRASALVVSVERGEGAGQSRPDAERRVLTPGGQSGLPDSETTKPARSGLFQSAPSLLRVYRRGRLAGSGRSAGMVLRRILGQCPAVV